MVVTSVYLCLYVMYVHDALRRTRDQTATAGMISKAQSQGGDAVEVSHRPAHNLHG